ncbi:MAG TPA: hypothetical protein VFA89_00880 [Terriglobales bacterium]|nr:hypothetical protein [Terriglobales bacterium]
MEKVIVFYIPDSFRKKASKWVPAHQKGRLLTFPSETKKSA